MEDNADIEKQTPNQIKQKVNDEYNEKPNGGAKTPLIIGGLAIVLIIIFIIVIVVFFIIGNNPQMHEIAVVNNCSQGINVMVGTEVKNKPSGEFFGPNKVNPGETAYYYATPGVYLVVKGYYDNGEEMPIPMTKALIWFNDDEYNGPTQISYNGNIMNVERVAVNGKEDKYDISMREGFNIEMGIVSTNFNNKNSEDPFSCGGPTWYYNIGENMCPNELRYIGNEYEGCRSACSVYYSDVDGKKYCCLGTGTCGITGGCQNEWPVDRYYRVFNDACPNCMITNCDKPSYYCESSGGLSQYVITFCPT